MKAPLKIRYDNYNFNWSSGVGKTTIVRDVAQKLKEGGVRVGGIVSREEEPIM